MQEKCPPGNSRRDGGRQQGRTGKHKKTGRTFLCVPPVLHLRSHSLIPVIHCFSDCSLIFMSYLFQIVVWIEPI